MENGDRLGGGVTRRGLMAGAAASAGGMLFSGCSGTERGIAPEPNGGGASQSSEGATFAFDTYCTFTVYGDDGAPAKLAQACARYDKLFDLYDASSDIARINASAGAPVDVDPETLELLRRALGFCESAPGLFDITIGSVSTLWDFKEGIRPADDLIAEALTHVNWRNVEIDDARGTVRLIDPKAKIDLGGIAKGFVADRLCELVQGETRARGAVISLGGNIAFCGEKPDGALWEAGVRDPNDPGGSRIVGTVRVDGGSLVTSGLYERTFELDGTTYWHILDPRTGMPVETDIVSDTVFCPSSTMADALSTTLFVAGSREGAIRADSNEDTAAFFMLQNDSTAESSRWQELTDFSSTR